MSFKDQVVNLIIQGRDLFSSEAKKSEKALAELGLQSEKLNEQLVDIRRQRDAIQAIDDLTDSISRGEKAYIDSAAALDKLVAEQKQAATDAKQLATAQKESVASTARLENEYNQTAAELAQLDTQLANARTQVERLTTTQVKGAAASNKQAKALAQAKTDLKQLETTHKNTAASASKLATELERERDSLEKLDDQVDNAAKAKAKYTLKVKEARSELNKLGSGVVRNKAELEKQQAVLKKAGVNMDKLADASKELKQQQAATQKALDGVNDELAQHNKLLTDNKNAAKVASAQTDITTKAVRTLAKAYAALLAAQQAVQAVRGGVENYGELEAAITKVEKTTGNARDTVEAMAAELKDLSEKVTPTATNELLRMAEVAGQLGTKSTQDILNLVSAADALGLSTNLAGDEAATMLARILGMTQEGIPEIHNLSSAVVALGNDFAITEADIVHMTKEIVSGTREINLGSAAAAAFGTTLGELGQPAERSRTAIQRLGAEINRASKEGGDSLERLTKITGLTAQEIEQQLGEAPEKVMVKFLEGLQAIKAEGGLVSDALNAMGITGTEASGVISVLADGTERLKSALELSNKAYAAGDFHMKEAAKAYADQEAAIGRLQNKFHNLTASIGEAFSDDVDAAINSTSVAIDLVGEEILTLSGYIPEVIGGFSDLLDAANNFTNIFNDGTLRSSIQTFDELALNVNRLTATFNTATLGIQGALYAAYELSEGIERLAGIDTTALQGEMARLGDKMTETKNSIKRDVDEINEINKRLAGESSIAYKDFNDTMDKYGYAISKLSQEQQKQIRTIIEENKYNAQQEELYRKLTASIVRANRELEVETALKEKAAADTKKKADADKEAAVQNESHADSQAKVNTNILSYADAVAEVEQKQLELNRLYREGTITADGLKRASAALVESLSAYNVEVDTSNQKTATQAELTAEFLAKRKALQAQYEQGLLTEKELVIAQQELAIAYDNTVAAASESAGTTGLLSEAQLSLQEKIVNSEAEIRKLEKALKDENKTTAELIIIKAKLAKEEANVADMKRESAELAKIENATYTELLILQREYETQLQLLDRSFKAGLITKQEYESQSKSLKDTLSEVSKVVGDSSEKTRENTKEIAKNSAALRDNASANVEYVNSLAAQITTVEQLRNTQTSLRSVMLDSGRVYADTGASVAELTDRLNALGYSYLNNEQKRQRTELSASLRLAKLIEQIDSGAVSAARLDSVSRQATRSMYGLSGVHLNPLINSIERAKDRLDAMRQSADDTLSSLRDELDNLQGNDLAIQQREYDRKLSELREQLKAAQQSGDKDLLAQLKESEQLLKRINDLRVKDIKDEAKRNEVKSQPQPQAQTPEPPKTTPQPQPVQQPPVAQSAASGEVVTLRLQAGPVQLDLNAQKNLLNLLMDEIRRQQRLGT